MTVSEREVILRIEHITKRFPLEDGKVLTACNDIQEMSPESFPESQNHPLIPQHLLPRQ